MNNISAKVLTRWAGAFAVLAGILYIGIQAVHPPDELDSVSTSAWATVACLTLAMSVFSLIGVTGIYVRQAEQAGWLGLTGYSVFSLFWLTSAAFSFVEAVVLPMLAADAPQYVEGVVGIFGGAESEADLGALPVIAPLAGVMYALGGLLLGVATYRSGVLPRLAAALLAFGAVVTLAAAVIPHPFDRILAVPMGVALIWLGYALWSERGSSIDAQARHREL